MCRSKSIPQDFGDLFSADFILAMASFFSNSARAAAAASSSKSKPEPVVAARSPPWVEKYRPKTLEEVRSQDHATLVLKRLVNASNLPHLLYVVLEANYSRH